MSRRSGPERSGNNRSTLERISADLRSAADAYEPDSERIRQIMEGRSSGLFPTSALAQGRVPARRRPILLPVAGSASAAAAAAAIFAVVAGGGLPGTAGPAGPGSSGSVTVDVAGQVGVPTGSASGSGSVPAPSSPSGPSPTTTTPSSGAATTTPPASTSQPGRTTSRSGAAPTSRAGAAPAAGAAGATKPGNSAKATTSSTTDAAGQQVTTTRFTGAGRNATITVRATAQGTAVPLGGQGHWLVAATDGGGSPAINGGNDNFVGPLQQGDGSTTATGPFRITWPNGASSHWLVARTGSGEPGAFRLPVRFRTSPATATLYVGTVSGRGRITVTLGGTGGSETSVDLPNCTSTCASVVTITVSPAAGTTAATEGDFTVDLNTLDAGGRIGLAAATLR